MAIQYIKLLDVFVVKDKTGIRMINATALKKHCEKYCIPMKKYRDLYNYLQSEKFYLSKECYGYN